MITAIVYTSNTGSTKRYAELLGEKIELPVYSLENSPVPADSQIIYMGWVMASGIKGYKRACSKYKVRAVSGVCMGATGSQLAELRKANKVPESIPVFTLQGGFDINKLHGIYKFMMNAMIKTTGKALQNKTDRTPEEDDMLGMMRHGGDRVNEGNLKALLDWFNGQKKRGE